MTGTPPRMASEELPDDAPRLDGVAVLVVDRNEEVREVVSRILKLSGAEVDTATSVTEAMTSVARRVPDVLVSEIDMEGETGYSLHPARCAACPWTWAARCPRWP